MSIVNLRKRSLTVKLLALSLLVGLVVYICSDLLFIRRADQTFREQFKERLQLQTMDGQMRFDVYVKAHFQLARLIVNQERFAAYLRHLSPAQAKPRILEREPSWLPSRSTLRAFTHALYYFLLDEHGQVIEVYNSGGPVPPASLLAPDPHVLSASHNENFMTMLDGTPYIISSASHHDQDGKSSWAGVMLATPIDDELLLFLLPPIKDRQIVALVSGSDPIVLATSNPDVVPKGIRLAELEDGFLIVGRTVYNYEYSDLLVTYTHLMPLERVRQLAGPIVLQGRLQLLAVIGMFIIIFTMLLVRITRRIETQTRNIVEFTEQALEGNQVPLGEGDELLVLENRFRLLTEEVLASRHSQAEFLQTLIEASPAPIFFKDAAGRYLGCNRAFEDFIGKSRDKVIGKSVYDIAPPALADLYDSMDRELFEQGGRQVYEATVHDAEGNLHNVLFNKSVFRKSDGALGGLVGIVVDITDRKAAEVKVANALSLLQSLINSTPDLIFYKDEKSVYLGCNKAFAEFVGFREEDVVGRSDLDFFPEDLAEFFREKDRQMLRRGDSLRNEEWVTDCHGRQYYFDTLKTPYYESDGKILGLIGISRDITERRLAEEERQKLQGQLRQAQKMEAIGTLAGGIAHDFNNILSAILGFTELAQTKVPATDPVGYDLEQVLNAGLRAKDLVKQILAFSRQGEQEGKPINIHLQVKEALKLLRASLPTTIEIQQRIDSTVCPVIADPTQMHQIVMNICTNAYHAMREKGGILSVDLRQVVLSLEGTEPGMVPGSYVLLEITDNGPGITSSVLERIFEPYFTTKGKGEGTGLGLAVVHGIVRSHHGKIRVESTLGEGTTFFVYLPCVAGHAGAIERQSVRDEIPRGSESILVVDDEEAIVEIEKKLLENIGYQVTGVTGSMAALNLLKSDANGFDLVITDMTMPNMTGAELARQILEIRPDLPIILCTGFSETINEEEARVIGIREYLLKPIVLSDTARIIRRILDQPKMR